MIFYASYILIPGGSLATIAYYWHNISEDKMQTRFGAIYESLATDRGRTVLLAPINFLMRRALLVLLVLYANEVLIFQIMALCFIAIIVASSLHRTEALNSSGEIRMETFTELIILQCAHCFLCFNVVSVEDNFKMGYIVIGLLGIYALVCIGLILIGTIAHFIKSLKMKFVMRRYRKSRKKLQARLKD